MAKTCKRCGREYDPLGTMGRWECRAHRLPLDHPTGRYPCCQVSLRDQPASQILWPIHLTSSDILGCYAADHDVEPQPEWPPYEMMTYHAVAEMLDPVVRTNGRTDGPPLTFRRTYANFAASHPSFATPVMRATLDTAESFRDGIVIPLLTKSLMDTVFYHHLAATVRTPNLPTTAFQARALRILLLDQFRAAIVRTGLDQLRVEFTMGQPPVTIATLIARVPIDDTFWSRMQELVAVVGLMDSTQRERVVQAWAAGLLAPNIWPIIPVVAVLRASPSQDGTTLARADANNHPW